MPTISNFRHPVDVGVDTLDKFYFLQMRELPQARWGIGLPALLNLVHFAFFEVDFLSDNSAYILRILWYISSIQ